MYLCIYDPMDIKPISTFNELVSVGKQFKSQFWSCVQLAGDIYYGKI